MSGSTDRWSALRRVGRAVLLAAFAVAFGITLALAQQGQQGPQMSPKAGASSWVKVCTQNEKTGNKQVCLVKYEGLEPKTGTVLITAAVRTIEGEAKQYLLVNVPTAYSLVMPRGVQIKIDQGEPNQLQFSVCLPENCLVQMELSKETLDKMRKGKQLVVAAINTQQKSMLFPLPLEGFAKTSDGVPVDNAEYQKARAQMMQAARQHQIELAKKAAAAQQLEPQTGAQPQSDGAAVAPLVPNATIVPKKPPAAAPQ
jgi:invasion protein IalB